MLVYHADYEHGPKVSSGDCACTSLGSARQPQELRYNQQVESGLAGVQRRFCTVVMRSNRTKLVGQVLLYMQYLSVRMLGHRERNQPVKKGRTVQD